MKERLSNRDRMMEIRRVRTRRDSRGAQGQAHIVLDNHHRSIPGALPQATLNIAFGEKRWTNHLGKVRNGQSFGLWTYRSMLLANGHGHHSQGHRPWEALRMNKANGQTATETTSIPGALPQATLNIAFGEKRWTNHLGKVRNGQP